ncbi:MAG: undecaprenyldiphospho-muramoylpentapeptide beta-N-acetylglucosaminyltransferase [Bacteroidetes bacterium]|nr:undecaprenyldiphospho-muramoylpentapeptide beta-N-acetylglucosaminyltransferase [Bacteroidota bacterium]
MNSLRFIIAGGGTGGHIFPALSIAEAIRKLEPTARFQFVGARGKMEMEKVPQAGFDIEGLDIVGFDRHNPIKNFSLPIKLLRSFFHVRSIFRRFRPTAVVGVGGYSSYPVLRYAQAHRIPTFLHEANSYAGKSNQWLAKHATQIFVGMRGMEKFFPADKMVITGNPVRINILQSSVDRTDALLAFGLDPAKPTVLVVGGSLGARSINEALQAGWEKLIGAGIQLIWQTGQSGASLPPIPSTAVGMIHRTPFIKEMDKGYAAADLVVSRSGAMSIAELEVVGKPAILVPYPLAAEDHQTSNARQLVEAGAALLVRDSDVANELIDRVLELMRDESRRWQMGAQSHQLGVRDADRRIATWILKNIKTNESEPTLKTAL